MTEDRANELFPHIQEIIYNKYKNETGLKYFAIIKSKELNYLFEIGANEKMTLSRLNKIKKK